MRATHSVMHQGAHLPLPHAGMQELEGFSSLLAVTLLLAKGDLAGATLNKSLICGFL